MSEQLWIMRHAEAGGGFPDATRRLTPRGEGEARIMATWLAQTLEHSVRDSLRLLASPYQRAQQTADMIAEALNCEVETLPGITPDDSPAEVIEWLQQNTGRPLLLVSHMPLVGDLTACLVDGVRSQGLGFATAAVATLETEVWAAGCARLLRFITPADLG